MKKDNKIIPFYRPQRKKKSNLKLEAKLSVHIWRENNKYSLKYYSDIEEITEYQIYCILKRIYDNLEKEINISMLKFPKDYDVFFSLFYYTDNDGKYSYICFPQDTSKEKLFEYLLLSTIIYEQVRN